MTRQDFVRGQQTQVSPNQAILALNQRWALASAADFETDIDVLNYALTLEYLEAAYYQQGNALGLVSAEEAPFFARIQADEEAHVAALSDTITKLGGTPVEKPGVSFGAAFADRNSFLTTSHTFENVGVGAYLGAAGYIKDKQILQAAAGIFGVEARHAAVVGVILGLPAEGGVYFGANEKPMAKADVLTAVTPFLMDQMGSVPTGWVDTGGGSTASGNTAGGDGAGWFAVGGAALLGVAGAAAYAHHKSEQQTEA